MAIKTNLTDLKPARDRFCRTVTLLSRGYYAPQSFPNGQITIYPWDTSIDEWFTNQSRKKGTKGANLMFDVLPKICNLNGCPVDEFLASEAVLILMVSRRILHKDAVQFGTVCPHCGNQQTESVKIPDELGKIGEKPEGYPGWDEITLDTSKDTVRMKPYRIGDMRRLVEMAKEPVFRTIQVSDSVIQVTQSIIDIGGGKPDSAHEILNWFLALHPGDAEQLLHFYDSIQPSLDTSVVVECEDNRCGKTFDYKLQLDADFFRRRGLPGASQPVGAANGAGPQNRPVLPGSDKNPGVGTASGPQKA